MNLTEQTYSILTREQKVSSLFAMIAELRGEQKIEAWIAAHPQSSIWVTHVHGKLTCVVIDGGVTVGKGTGDDSVEARKQAFSVVFLNEATVTP